MNDCRSTHTKDSSSVTSIGVQEEGEVCKGFMVFSEFWAFVTDKFHLLIGGLYAGLAVGVAALRRGSFEL